MNKFRVFVLLADYLLIMHEKDDDGHAHMQHKCRIRRYHDMTIDDGVLEWNNVLPYR